MKLLVDMQQNIYYISEDFEIRTDRVIVKDCTGVWLLSDVSLNQTNSYIIHEPINLNEQLVKDISDNYKKYNYDNGNYKISSTYKVPPETYDLNNIQEFIFDIPVELTEEYINLKIKKIIDYWKILNNKISMPTWFKEGVYLLDIDSTQLTEEQIQYKTKVKNLLLKMKARYLIEAEVGDTHDLIADMSKKISMLTRLVTRFIDEAWNGEEVPAEYKESYKQLVRGYVAAVDAGQIKDRGDLENNEVMFQKLTERDFKIQDITDREYFSKKEG